LKDEDSENANPKAKSGRKFLNKLPLPEVLMKSKSGNLKNKILLRISFAQAFIFRKNHGNLNEFSEEERTSRKSPMW
jgi:hypothetical protein